MRKDSGFRFFTGDRNWLDYGGTWSRHIPGTRRYHFIRLDNMDEACGRDNEGQPTYRVQLSEVDMDEISDDQINDAMRSYGNDDSSGLTDAECAGLVFEYGISSPLHSESTYNAYKGIAACRKESYRLSRDAEAYEEAMERPVNRLGSTAREFGRGDLNSALIRGLEAGDKSARIIGKMYIASNGQTLGGRLPESELAAIKEAYDRRRAGQL